MEQDIKKLHTAELWSGVCVVANLLGVTEGLAQLLLREVLSEVDDGVLQDPVALWIVTQPRGGVVKHMQCLPVHIGIEELESGNENQKIRIKG